MTILAMALPKGDLTPSGYLPPVPSTTEALKRPFRRWVYPGLNAVNHARLSSQYKFPGFNPDLWLWGQRGNDYERHRRRVAKMLPLEGRNILVAGCGTGQDLESWARLNPRSMVGVDWFSYERAWQLWKNRLSVVAPSVNVSFEQGNLEQTRFEAGSFDVISSDAVFEHLKNLPKVLEEFHRILRPGGILYSTFGPLWYGWGGDHVSGYDKVTSGYNHLLLTGRDYQDYLDRLGPYSHSEHDGRTWIEHDLFSRLTPMEYIGSLEKAGFRRRFVSGIIDPNAVACMHDSKIGNTLLKEFSRLDLLVSGMTIIYER